MANQAIIAKKQEVVNELKDQYGLKVYDNNSKKEI